MSGLDRTAPAARAGGRAAASATPSRPSSAQVYLRALTADKLALAAAIFLMLLLV